jgi:hypothetical protein
MKTWITDRELSGLSIIVAPSTVWWIRLVADWRGWSLIGGPR